MAAKRVPFQWPLGIPERECGSQNNPQGSQRFFFPMHESHFVEIRVTLDNGEETIFQNLHVSFCSYSAVNEYRTDYSVNRNRVVTARIVGLHKQYMLRHALLRHFRLQIANNSV